MHRQLQESDERASLKGVRWLLPKRRDSLDPQKREPERLAQALKLNSDLAAYFLKEELSEIWEQDDYETAEGMLLD